MNSGGGFPCRYYVYKGRGDVRGAPQLLILGVQGVMMA